MSETKEPDLPMVRVDGEIVEQPGVTPAQAKIDAIASLTKAAYARASELRLTPEEDKALAADFPDEAFRKGAGGDDAKIYIEHAFLRDRFNDVLGRGAWALVTRSRWTEEFKTSKGGAAVRVYSEVMMVIRGCYVTEVVGEMEYYPNNAKTTYADAIEGSKTAAFRRLAKDFGVGLQAWKKGFVELWWKRNPTGNVAPGSDAEEFLSAKNIEALNTLIAEIREIGGDYNEDKFLAYMLGLEKGQPRGNLTLADASAERFGPGMENLTFKLANAKAKKAGGK
jgi:hypothetical protein